MRIKHIELNGFKSFMDRTVLELPLGVSAIVGPNGCGKSNIVDAIRWVIGEQSPKHLRGDVMEDVICNGNADHGPLGMAEVSLLLERDEADFLRASADDPIDGGGDALPPELSQASEVLVSRRYFRSGESEYFINRVPCRLRDITELFLGTGVGTRAYAIIEQGRIEQIVNAKPEDLRLFIEEAAGVTRFRSRRIAAERKMERTKENLVRVQDVLRELERQKGSLERQAKRAEQYHRLKDELRELDLRVLASRHRTWSADTDRLQQEIAGVQREEDGLHAEIRRTQEATSVDRARRATIEDQLHGLEEELTTQRLRAGEAQSRAVSLRTRGEDLQARVAEADREMTDLGDRREALVADVERLQVEGDGLTATHEAAEVARTATEERLAELLTSGAAVTAAVEAAKDAVVDGVAEESRLRNLAEALRGRREEFEGRRRKIEEEQRHLGDRLGANERSREAARSARHRLDDEQATLVTAHDVLAERRRSDLQEEARCVDLLEERRSEATRVRSRADSLRELQARHEGCARGVATLLSRGPDGGALLAGILRVPAELERAVAAALGPRLSDVVVADTAAAVGGVRYLREGGGGSATLLPRETARRSPAIVPAGRRLLDQIEVDGTHWSLAEALLGQVLLADDLDEALRLWGEASYGVTVVTHAGEAIDPFGAVSGGSEAPLEEMLLARARELRELEDMLADREAAVGLAAGGLASARAAVASTTQQLAEREARLQALRVEVVASEKDRERLDEERARLTAELEVWAMEAGGLAGADDRAAEELVAIASRLAAAEAEVTTRRSHLAERQLALATWREAQGAAEQERTRRAVDLAAVIERRRAVEGELGRARDATSDVEARLLAIAEARRAAAAGAAAAAAAASEAEALGRAATARVAEVGSECEGLRAALGAATASLSADDDAERIAREQLEGLRDTRGSLEVALTERRLAVEHLREQLNERYGLDIDALAAVPVELDDEGEDRAARVEVLRLRLGQLGDVNPGALAELQDVMTRHGFLVEQRDDLERSLDDLRRTIGKLSRTSRERFAETFDAANAKLAEVFPKLFPGGQARLQLMESEEGGEPGVEIVVQPSGKKLQHLSLLSGGEKALTATALVLSLFLIRPTPFCILDEVDAPLDEANIGRFNQLVREMAENTQFVLITHNRRTMEVADTLYGITMEQPGLSKVVSVRLREAA